MMFFDAVRTRTQPSADYVFMARFDVHLGRTPALSAPATGGIALLAAQSVVLVADLGGLGLPNGGVSATNAMEHIVAVYGEMASHLGFDPHAASWVEIDSDGFFDLVQPAGGACTFRPVVSASGKHAPRTRGAFLETFPETGQILLDRLARMVSSERVLH